MYQLQNDLFNIEVLDPSLAEDARYLGARYIHGAYIWRWLDKSSGENLISGPRYPDPSPPVFHGQGLPEVFRHNDKDSGDLLFPGDDRQAMVPGVGLVDFSQESPLVTRPCTWTVDQQDAGLVFTTQDEFKGWGYELIRELELSAKQLLSKTMITNRGPKPLHLQWYAHPFFAVDELKVSLEFGAPVQLPQQHQGFEGEGHVLNMPAEKAWGEDGFFCWLERYPTDSSLHLQYTNSSFSMSYEGDLPIDRIALWGNQRTVSLEPYLKSDLEPGKSLKWEMRYRRD